MAVYDSGERAGQVGLWIDGIELARLDERGDGRPILCSRVVPGEESVLPIERYRPDSSLDTIVVDLDTTDRNTVQAGARNRREAAIRWRQGA